MTLPVVITVYSDRTFEFIIKSPPAAVLLKKAAGIPIEKKKGGDVIPGEEKTKRAASTRASRSPRPGARTSPRRRLPDLNARDMEHASRIIEGTARSLGLTVEG